MSALDVAQIITAGAAAVAAGVAVWQSRMTQHQLDITMRPWLSAEYNAVIYNTNGQVIVPFRNYGQTPALNAIIRTGAAIGKITIEQLRSREPLTTHITIVPNATREISLDIEKDLQPKVASGAISLHVAALIEYEYAKDGRGEYVISSQYNFNTGANAIDYEWSK